MYLCYMDESGGRDPFLDTSKKRHPLFVLASLYVHQNRISALTHDFLEAKMQRYPGRCKKENSDQHYLNAILGEVKGDHLRREALSDKRGERSNAIGFLDDVLALLDFYEVYFTASVVLKPFGQPFDGNKSHAHLVKTGFQWFQQFVTEKRQCGLVFHDNIDPHVNKVISHHIFTQKHQRSSTGDPFPDILEMPTFVQSENHAGIQMADILVSALLYPISLYSYFSLDETAFFNPAHRILKERFAERLQKRQYRFQTPEGHWTAGLNCWDMERPSGSKRNSRAFFQNNDFCSLPPKPLITSIGAEHLILKSQNPAPVSKLPSN